MSFRRCMVGTPRCGVRGRRSAAALPKKAAAKVENRLCNSLISTIISDNSAFFEGARLPRKLIHKEGVRIIQFSKIFHHGWKDPVVLIRAIRGIRGCIPTKTLSNRVKLPNCTKLH